MGVVIVGAGPAGVGLAYLLARKGVGVTLLERETDFDRVFRGEGLMPSGVDALYQMGLDGLLNRLPTRKMESWDIYIEGRAIMEVHEPHEELGEMAMRVIPQPLFLQGVIDEAAKFPGFRFVRGANVRDFVMKGERVAGVVAQTEAGEEKFDADLVVGCDGRGSLMRTRAGLELKTLPGQYDVLWFKLPAPDRLKDTCRMMMYASREGMGASYTSWDGRLQFALIQMKGARKELSKREWAEEMGRPTPAWMRVHLLSAAEEMEGPVRLNVIVGRSDPWWKPGLLLLGDAAHPMGPIRAQGINVALRDAIVAANHLVSALGNGNRAIEDGLVRIQAEREPEIARSQTLQHRDTRGIGSWYAPLMIGLAGAIGPTMGKYAWARKAWLDQQKDLRFGSARVKLEV